MPFQRQHAGTVASGVIGMYKPDLPRAVLQIHTNLAELLQALNNAGARRS
jgi:hypothetical protein